jgi:hypothetical protein
MAPVTSDGVPMSKLHPTIYFSGTVLPAVRKFFVRLELIALKVADVYQMSLA